MTRAPVNPWVIALVVALTTFMEVLDISIANVSLRHIAGDLSAGQDESAWVLTSYLVTNAIVLPISGWFAYVVGRRRFYLWCVVIFTVSSLFCGLASSLPLLILARTIQGAGGGGLQPISQAILADTFPPEKRGMAFAVYGITTVLAPAIGPTLGGWITDNVSWRWIFFINVPVGIVAFMLSYRLLFDPPHLVEAQKKLKARHFRIDALGFSLLAIGLGALQIMLDKGQQEDWFQSPLILGLALIAGVSLVLLPFRELQHPDPMVDLRLLGHRNFALCNVLMLFLGFVLFGSTLLIPLFCQTELGYSATEAGLVISPGGVIILFIMPIVGMLVNRMDVRYMIIIGLSVCSFALLLLTTISLEINYERLAVIRIVQATGLAFLFIPINTAAFSGLPMEKSSAASALINLSRNIGGSVGIALTEAYLARHQTIHRVELSQHLDAGSLLVNDYLKRLTDLWTGLGHPVEEASRLAMMALNRTLEAQASMLAFRDTFWFLALLFIGLIPMTFLLRRPMKPKAPVEVH